VCRSVASELSSDITFNVNGHKFELHKVQCSLSVFLFPKHKLCLTTTQLAKSFFGFSLLVFLGELADVYIAWLSGMGAGV
jgi:hypothetical protein